VRRCALAFALAVAGGADAARIESLTVDHRAGLFTANAVVALDAPPAAVRAVLTDYANLARLSPSIVESRLLGRDDHGALVFTRSKACTFWFCRELRKTELVVERGDEIVASSVDGRGPAPSTVTHSRTRWRLSAQGAGTRLEILSEVDPAFAVPPLIGPPLVKKTMKRETEKLARGIEAAARAHAPAATGASAAPDASVPPQAEPADGG
jgi:hypothetical protein